MSFRVTTAALFTATLLLWGCSFELVGLGDSVWTGQDSVSSEDAVQDGVVADLPTPDGALPDVPDEVRFEDTVEDLHVDWDSVSPPECNSSKECDDEVSCTVDQCVSGYCSHVPDDSACPELEECATYTCDVGAGCVRVARTGEPCALVDKCVESASCDETGVCHADVMVNCKSGPCMSSVCQPDTGECSYTVLNGGSCDDGNPCTLGDRCEAGACAGDVNEEACLCQEDTDCLPYATGNLCNGSLVCLAGHCSVDNASMVLCPAAEPNSCFEWQCDAQTGGCIKVFLALGTLCSDGNPCTKSDHCDAGSCVGTAVPDQSPCNLDEDACTQDQCQQGVCVAGPAKVCSAVSQCSVSQCDALSGKCVTQPLSGQPCDDQDECTSGETCLWGECSGGVYTCVECAYPEMNGRPCNDGIAQTVGDFCYRESCRGFLPAPLSASLGLATALAVEQDLIHLVASGSTSAGGDASYGIWEYLWDGTLATWVGLGADTLLDASGPVAVGKPGLVYYRGLGWTANNALRATLASTCPGFGVESKPISVTTIDASSSALLGGFGSVVWVGFEASGMAITDGCVVARCYQVLPGGVWVCDRIPLPAANVGDPDGLKVRITAMDSVVREFCDSQTALCLPGLDLVAGYELTKPGGWEWGLFETTSTGLGSLWNTEALFAENSAAVGAQSSGPVMAVEVRSDGSLVAGGGKGWLFSRAAGEDVGSVKSLPASLAAQAPDVVGIVLDDKTSAVLVNILPLGTGPTDTPLAMVGVLAGDPLWPFLTDMEGVVHLTPLRTFATCSTCGPVPDKALGIRDVVSLWGETTGDWGEGGRLVVADTWREGIELLGELLFLQP